MVLIEYCISFLVLYIKEVSLHVKCERVRVERDRQAWRHQNMCTLWHCSHCGTATRHVVILTCSRKVHVTALPEHLSERWKQNPKKQCPLVIACSLLYHVPKYHYAECINFCLRACLMDCCRVICWYRYPCFSCPCAHVAMWSET